MDLEETAREAAQRWGCSVRSVQMLCKQGAVPGARKVGGIWLLPADAVRPRSAEGPPALHPERLYGRNTAVRISARPGEPLPQENGCTITEYPILDGITLVFQEIHAEKLDYGAGLPQLPADLIAIQHCREGRFEGEYPDGAYVCLGPGSLSVNLPAWAPVSNRFPLKHYSGLYIAVLPGIAEPALRKLEAVLGPLQIDFQALSEHLSGKNRLALYSVDDGTARLLSALYAAPEAPREGPLKLLVLELLQLLCARSPIPAAPQPYFPRDQVRTVREIRDWLIGHPEEHVPLPELAARFRISLTALKTCFRGVYGQSVGRYVREYRMQAGAELLENGSLRIIEIAASLGYQNASKFSAAFAAFYGMTPTQYRKTFCLSGGLSDSEE